MSILQKGPLIFLIVLFSLCSSSTSRETLTPAQHLLDGEILVSSGGVFVLGFFTPANSTTKRYVGIWYNKMPGHAVTWVANRCCPIHDTTGILSITSNGSLVIADGNSTIIWSSALTTQVANPIAQLLDTGNLIVTGLDHPSSIAWQSFDYPTDTLLPGMKVGWDLKRGLNHNLTGWSSPADPSPGNYTFGVDRGGSPQVNFWSGSARKWRSGPWNGEIPYYDPDSFRTFSYVFVNNKEEITYAVDLRDNSSLTRLVVNPIRIMQRFVSLHTGLWGLYTYFPDTPCDSFGVCGPNSVCYPSASPTCSCLPGFAPRSPDLWALEDYSGGCIRKTVIDCRNGTDGFITLQRTLLPDTLLATVNMVLTHDECQAVCLRNCSCMAVARADVNGNGCIFWFTDLMDVQMYQTGRQEFYLRLAAADIDSLLSQSHWSRKALLAVVLSSVLGFFLLTTIFYCTWRKRRRYRGNSSNCNESIMENPRGDNMELPLYDLEVIKTATMNFSDENKLGEGGSGLVYKGKMRGQEIAVKRLCKASLQSLHELKAQAMLAAKLQHRNLVRLLGYCVQEDERLLVIEYMPNKSLDAFLFDEEKARALCWDKRYWIILGIARGLLYLHQDSRFPVIHRDLKASNILLDKDMNPKISDFGLARTFGGDETEMTTERIDGTYGYMAPEYALNGIFSMKSDVFSFGVLVLEIISGKRSKGVYCSPTKDYLLENAWAFWMEGNPLHLVDSSIDSSLPASEMLRCIAIGLVCVQEHPEDRPTMSSVVHMLGNDQFLPEPKRGGFVMKSLEREESYAEGKFV